MTITRIYQPIPLEIDADIALDTASSHHLARVLRAQLQQQVIVFNGKGGEYRGTITEINKKNVRVTLTTFHPRDAESPLELWLAQGISRGEKMDFTLQKAVELGVKKIIPLFTERSTVKLDEERALKKFLHWQGVIQGAVEQSGRTIIPELTLPMTFSAWLPTLKEEQGLILSPHQGLSLKKLTLKADQPIILLIGPEGGLSETETDLAEKKNFLPLRLGPRILRTETAALAAISALQTYVGDMT